MKRAALNPSLISKLDRSDMLGLIRAFPEQCAEGRAIGQRFGIPDNFKSRYLNIVCAGMGGSAIGGDLLRAYLAGEAHCPIFVNRNYSLPEFVGRDSLVIVSSYSGNTEETLAAYADAKEKGSKVVVVTSGGILKKLAREDANPVMLIPGGLPPRSAVGYSFFSVLVFLSRLGMIKDKSKDMDEAISVLDGLKDDKRAKDLAISLYGRFPVIYAGNHMDAVIARWRGQLAENSKTLSSGHVFPEMNHNEIVGWENPKRLIRVFAAVMLRDPAGDGKAIEKRIDVTKKILEKAKVKVVEVSAKGKGLLARILSLVYIGDMTSFYLAILNNLDPTPVDRITYLKKELSKR